MTLVSVLLPVHNNDSTVAEAIRSVQGQLGDGFDIELIVIDDGSTDATADAIRSTVDERAVLLSNPEASGGPATPRRLGLEVARGDWVAFIDGDDRWLPDKLAVQLAEVREEAIVYSRCEVDDHRAPGSLSDYHRRFGLASDQLPTGDLTVTLLERNVVPMVTAVVRRTWLDQVPAFTASRSGVDDYELWLRLALEGARFAAVEQPTAVYRWRPSSLSHSMDRARMKAELFCELADEHPRWRRDLRQRARSARRASARRDLSAARARFGAALGSRSSTLRRHDLADAGRHSASAAGELLRALRTR